MIGLHNERKLLLIKEHAAPIVDMSVSAFDKRVFAAVDSKQLTLWCIHPQAEAVEASLLLSIKVDAALASQINFTRVLFDTATDRPLGFALINSKTNTVQLWDAATHGVSIDAKDPTAIVLSSAADVNRYCRSYPHDSAVLDVSFSVGTNEQYFAVASACGKVYIYDRKQSAPQAVLNAYSSGPVNAVAWHVTRGFSASSAGRLLLTAGDNYQTLKLWAIDFNGSGGHRSFAFRCVSSLALAPGEFSASFNQMNVDVTGSWVVVSYKNDSSRDDDHDKFNNGFYVIHLRRPVLKAGAGSSGGNNKNDLDVNSCRFDYIAPFSSGQPIVSFWLAIDSNPTFTPADPFTIHEFSMFSAQTRPVQQFQMQAEHCYVRDEAEPEDAGSVRDVQHSNSSGSPVAVSVAVASASGNGGGAVDAKSDVKSPAPPSAVKEPAQNGPAPEPASAPESPAPIIPTPAVNPFQNLVASLTKPPAAAAPVPVPVPVKTPPIVEPAIVSTPVVSAPAEPVAAPVKSGKTSRKAPAKPVPEPVPVPVEEPAPTPAPAPAAAEEPAVESKVDAKPAATGTPGFITVMGVQIPIADAPAPAPASAEPAAAAAPEEPVKPVASPSAKPAKSPTANGKRPGKAAAGKPFPSLGGDDNSARTQPPAPAKQKTPKTSQPKAKVEPPALPAATTAAPAPVPESAPVPVPATAAPAKTTDPTARIRIRDPAATAAPVTAGPAPAPAASGKSRLPQPVASDAIVRNIIPTASPAPAPVVAPPEAAPAPAAAASESVAAGADGTTASDEAVLAGGGGGGGGGSAARERAESNLLLRLKLLFQQNHSALLRLLVKEILPHQQQQFSTLVASRERAEAERMEGLLLGISATINKTIPAQVEAVLQRELQTVRML